MLIVQSYSVGYLKGTGEHHTVNTRQLCKCVHNMEIYIIAKYANICICITKCTEVNICNGKIIMVSRVYNEIPRLRM